MIASPYGAWFVSQRLPSIVFCLAFAVIQALGFVLPQYANVHTNPAPLFLGVFLLLPGSIAVFFLPESTPIGVQCGLICGINLMAWYAFGYMRQRSAGHP